MHYYQTSAPGTPNEHYADDLSVVLPIFAGAVATGLGALCLSGRDPVSPEEAEQMVREYNTNVLGHSRRTRMTLTPWAAGTSRAGIGLVGTF